MATIDSRIAMGFQPQTQLESPVNALARVLQVQGLQQQNQASQMKVEESVRAQERSNRLADLYRGAVNPDGTIDRNRLFAGAAQAGFGEQIPALQEQFAKADKQAGEVKAQDFKLASDRYGMFKKTLGSLSASPNLSKDLVIQTGQELVNAGILPPEMFQRSVANLPDDPNALRASLRQSVATQLTPEQMLTVFAPKVEKIDNGQQISFRDTNPNSPTFGQQTAGATVQKQQTPDSIASNATTRRGQDLKFQTDSQANTVAGQAIVSKKVQDVELKLQDDYRTESKGFAETSTAMKKVLSAIETADKNPGSALSAGTAFMKILDPNSVVRETELGMALNASGWFDRATNIVNTLQSGRVMTETQKKNLRQAAQDLFEEAKASQREVDAAYEKRAREYGADPQRVIVDRGQRSGAASTAPGLPSSDAIQAEIERRAKATRGGR